MPPMLRALLLFCACLPAVAHANGDLLARLALQLRQPIAWAALTTTSEGRALSRRVLGRPLAEAADIDPFIRALEGMTDAERVAQELHVRLFRLQREALWRESLAPQALGPVEIGRAHV